MVEFMVEFMVYFKSQIGDFVPYFSPLFGVFTVEPIDCTSEFGNSVLEKGPYSGTLFVLVTDFYSNQNQSSFIAPTRMTQSSWILRTFLHDEL